MQKQAICISNKRGFAENPFTKWELVSLVWTILGHSLDRLEAWAKLVSYQSGVHWACLAVEPYARPSNSARICMMQRSSVYSVRHIPNHIRSVLVESSCTHTSAQLITICSRASHCFSRDALLLNCAILDPRFEANETIDVFNNSEQKPLPAPQYLQKPFSYYVKGQVSEQTRYWQEAQVLQQPFCLLWGQLELAIALQLQRQ